MEVNRCCTKEGLASHLVLSLSVNAAAAIKQLIPPKAVTEERLAGEATGEDTDENVFFVGRGDAHLRKVLVAKVRPAFIYRINGEGD